MPNHKNGDAERASTGEVTPKLTDTQQYACGTIRIVKKVRTSKDDTTVYFKFRRPDLESYLVQKYCTTSGLRESEVLALLLRNNLSKNRAVLSLGLTWPPEPTKAFSRARIAVDHWLEQLIFDDEESEEDEEEHSPIVTDFWADFFNYKVEVGDWGVARRVNAEAAFRNRIGPQFGWMRLNTISPSDIEDWYRVLYRYLAPRTVEETVLYLNMMFKRAQKLDREEVFQGSEPYRLRHGVSPFELVTKPKAPAAANRKHLILDTYDVQFLLQCAAEFYPTMFVLLLTFIDTGMRWGEVSGLRWSDIEMHTNRSFLRVARSVSTKSGISITDGKTAAAQRVIPMTTRLATAFRSWYENAPCPQEYRKRCHPRTHVSGITGSKTTIWTPKNSKDGRISICSDRISDDGYVFCSVRNWEKNNPKTGILSYGTMSTRLKNLKVRAGMQKDGSWHDFRYTFISNAVNRGVDRAWLKGVVGHTNLRQLDHYTQQVGNDHSQIDFIYDDDSEKPYKPEPKRSPKSYRKNLWG